MGLVTAGAAGCGFVQCADPRPERVPALLAESNIVLPADAELIEVEQGCMGSDTVEFSVELPPGSVDSLLRTSSLDAPLQPLTYPRHVTDGAVVEPGPGAFVAEESDGDDPLPHRQIVIDYSDPDHAAIHIIVY
jgi:hypothetical protein